MISKPIKLLFVAALFLGAFGGGWHMNSGSNHGLPTPEELEQRSRDKIVERIIEKRGLGAETGWEYVTPTPPVWP